MLDQGIAELRLSGSALERKEIEVISAVKALENKTLSLRNTEDEMISRRIISSSAKYEHISNTDEAATLNVLPKRDAPNVWSYAQRENIGNFVGTELPQQQHASQPVGAIQPTSVQYLSESERNIERELKNIRRSIQMSKQRTSSVRNAFHF